MRSYGVLLVLKITIFYTLWFIWKARNTLVFEGKNPNPTQAIIQVNQATTEFLNCKTLPNPSNRSASGVMKCSTRWRPPRDGMAKINMDASFNPASGTGSSGIIIRDGRGKVISGTTSQIFAPSAFIAEALALREDISLAASLNIKSVGVESDCATLVETCRGNTIRKDIEHILKDIQRLREDFTWIGFLLTSREGNSVADTIVTSPRPPSSIKLGDRSSKDTHNADQI